MAKKFNWDRCRTEQRDKLAARDEVFVPEHPPAKSIRFFCRSCHKPIFVSKEQYEKFVLSGRVKPVCRECRGKNHEIS